MSKVDMRKILRKNESLYESSGFAVGGYSNSLKRSLSAMWEDRYLCKRRQGSLMGCSRRLRRHDLMFLLAVAFAEKLNSEYLRGWFPGRALRKSER